MLGAWGGAEVEEVDFACRGLEAGGRHRPRPEANETKTVVVVECRVEVLEIRRLLKRRRRVPQVAFFGTQGNWNFVRVWRADWLDLNLNHHLINGLRVGWHSFPPETLLSTRILLVSYSMLKFPQ